jgi:hypothetical protein
MPSTLSAGLVIHDHNGSDSLFYPKICSPREILKSQLNCFPIRQYLRQLGGRNVVIGRTNRPKAREAALNARN